MFFSLRKDLQANPLSKKIKNKKKISSSIFVISYKNRIIFLRIVYLKSKVKKQKKKKIKILPAIWKDVGNSAYEIDTYLTGDI